MKTIIIYQSIHHQNTKKIIDYIASHYTIRLLNISQATSKIVNQYQQIIFATGVYFSKPHRLFYEIIPKLNIKNKDIFLITTSGCFSIPIILDYHYFFKKFFKDSGLNIKSWYETRGYDSYPFFTKPFGGINKNRPNQPDLDNALMWFCNIINQ